MQITYLFTLISIKQGTYIFLTLQDFRPFRHVDDCSVVSCGLSISKQLCGKRLYYKYMLFSSVFEPVEMLFIKQPITEEEVNQCYRVWTIPVCTNGLSGLNIIYVIGEYLKSFSEVTVFDSCIYPKVIAKPSFTEIVKGWFTSTNAYKLPELLVNEQQYCIKVHLHNVFEQIEQCQYSSEDDVQLVYFTIIRVHSSFLNAKKVNARVLNQQCPLLDGSSIQV